MTANPVHQYASPGVAQVIAFLLCWALPLVSVSAREDWDTTQPRGVVREIDFTTTEGTIQALDVSPDGRWILFDLLGHIYRIPASGGAAECLTQASGIALNYDPRYSPDGRRIAFISDRTGQNSLWVMNADGSQARLVAEGGSSWIGEPAWLPDGLSIVAVRHFIRGKSPFGSTDPTQIWRFPLTGDEATRLLGGALSFVGNPGLSPDGLYLYYEQHSDPQNIDGLFQVGDAHHVRRLDLRSGASQPVTEPESRKMYWGTPLYAAASEISPDGRRLAFVRRVPFQIMSYRGRSYEHATGLWIRDLDSGRERLLTSPITPDHLDTSSGYHLRFAPRHAWTGDGRSIVFTAGGQIRRVDISSGELTTIPFSARVRRTISEMARAKVPPERHESRTPFIRHATSSPDGNTLLFEAAGRLWRMGFPGGTPQLLTTEDGADTQFTPSWSPDGRRITYATWKDGAGGHVWSLPRSGGRALRMSREPGEYLHPTWSPDGRRLLAIRGSGAMFRGLSLQENPYFELVQLHPPGMAQPLARLTQLGPFAFGPDGRIYFVERTSTSAWTGPASGQSEYQRRTVLISIQPDGGDRREHAYFPFAREAAVSADGASVAFREAGNILIASLTSGTGVPFLNRDDETTPIHWLSRTGGLDVRWRNASELEFVNGARYFRHDRKTGRTDSIEIELPVQPRAGPRRIALTGARILTMQARRVIEQGSLVVTGNRIECVGECDIRGVDRVIDARGKTIIPGLIDAHSHPQWDSGLLRTHHPGLAAYLAYGITTVFDPSASEESVFPSADLIASGRLRGPRTFSTGPAETPDGDVRPICSYQDAHDSVQRLASWGAISLKQYMQPRRDQRQWLTEAVRQHGSMGITGERLNLHFDLGMIMDGQSGWEHVLTEHPIYSDVTRFVAAAGTNYTPALQAVGQGLYPSEYWRARQDLREDAKFRRFTPWRNLARFTTLPQRPMREYPIVFWTEGVKDILRAGGSVSIGAHGREDGIGPHWEIWTFASAITAMEALETATLNPSRYLGLGADLGTLERGKLADLVVLNGNPLDDIRSTIDIEFVMQDGVLYDDESLDRIWPGAEPYGARDWSWRLIPPPAQEK